MAGIIFPLMDVEPAVTVARPMHRRFNTDTVISDLNGRNGGTTP